MKRQSGHGMVLALVVLVIMMTSLGLLASSMRMSMLEDKRGFRTVSLVAMSDAVMAETLGYLADSSEFEGVEEREFGDGKIASRVRPYGTWRVEILTRATYGGQHRDMRALVAMSGGSPTVLSWRRARRGVEGGETLGSLPDS